MCRDVEQTELVIIDFDMLVIAPAWHDMGEPFGNMGFNMGTLQPEPMPPLQQRRDAAAAYLQELGEATCRSYKHSSEVQLDC